ncbi:GntR family transcriptional regulator [Curtobacterium sp. MCBD17_021]|uniref:GntR family transcriptional regulator n=1 Tax=Curtobacterium sp. MCBD17_021 TaxID=2175665 RepID=UPI002816900E|nr:GntR family transcriptional regulator [Curtobacterium sp. MCBD17_021]
MSGEGAGLRDRLGWRSEAGRAWKRPFRRVGQAVRDETCGCEDGTLVPGERLNDDQLTAWLGVSRTPVREAIARLVAEGFVEMAANRYTKVSSLSSREVRLCKPVPRRPAPARARASDRRRRDS